MSYIAKFERAQAELFKAGIWRSNSTPPILVALRKLGLKPRPFHYRSILTNCLTSAVWYGCIWGGLMWLIMWNSQQMPIPVALVTSASAGLLFGGIMAFYYKRSASKNGLSSWDDL